MGHGLYLLDHLEAETFVEGVVADIGALQIRGSLDLIDLMFEECGADPPAGNSGTDGREIPVRVRRADGRGGASQRNTPSEAQPDPTEQQRNGPQPLRGGRLPTRGIPMRGPDCPPSS
ncbi:Uncharacterised protein [Mycobacteroides abscessus]|nr:Uncharacterised protein [Mycobacteroides abscessus]